MSKKRYYYATGNTSKGYINFLATNISNIEQVIVLKHPSHTVKTAILENIINHYGPDGALEIICSVFGSSFIEGVIMREQSLAIVTDAIATSVLKGATEIDLADLLPQRSDQLNLRTKTLRSYELRQEAYDHFSKGLCIHDKLEGIYIREMNFNKADELAADFIKNLLKDVPKQQRKPSVYHRFFGTNTAEGAVNILPKITDHLSHRVYIKGRAGTGKSVFMKKVAKACRDYGFDVERYHCSFDPDSIDMILVPRLDFCIFDSTDPHEYSPERDGDVIIDLYEQTVTPGTDEKYAKKINEVSKCYKAHLRDGIDCLKQAQLQQDKLEQEYMNIDQVTFNEVTKKILKHIL